ncbi:membrane dipeptidase [Amycolatopsis rhabdoformis]|uniref:Membrane dipeptidase n=1 Tax=Amycolatopsis rhabdoformis TaxID=1448059 RepID=A0ABZ1ILG1_9PSEU|nr:membrane dipeptidase [Amycolatopsis rhabdoformis]WSE34330.1 membrane dipeptidase [Amycolatopsis rhabdoformis]
MTPTRGHRQAAGYQGYRSFGYLEPGGDYQDFVWTPEIDRLPPYDLGLDEQQARRAERLLQDNLVISLHDHPQVFPQDMSLAVDYGRTGRYPVGFEGLSYSGLDVMFDNLAGPTGCIMSHYSWTWADVAYDIGHRLADLAHQDYVRVVRTVADIREIQGSGRLGWVLALEAASMIDNDLDRLDLLHGWGIRQMGLVYNESNLLGGGLKEHSDGGLTRFGHRAVRRMNQLGISVDLSHAGDRTSIDAIAASERPVMITHAGARGVWPTERMKPDHVLRALAEGGGLLGIEAAPNSTISPRHAGHTIESVMHHFEYCVDLMGIDHVTLGPDTLYADHAKIHTEFAALFGATVSAPVPASGPGPDSRVGVEDVRAPKAEYCAGMENPTECFRNAIGWLVKHGYSDEDILKVAGGNTLRVLEQTWI